MYLAIPTQPDCITAWREAVRHVDHENGHSAYNVLIDISDPVIQFNWQDPRLAIVDDFLTQHGKPIETVANTIFPESLYFRYGAPDFFDAFKGRVLNKVRRNQRWSGYYFERMIQHGGNSGQVQNQLWEIVMRMRNPQVRALNKFELSIFDPLRDVDNSPYGGQCLSFLSFKLIPGAKRTLTLTATYRNHFYIEKLLGNLIGLGRLMSFVAREADLRVGSLTVLSTHAEIDLPQGINRSSLAKMLRRFDCASSTPATVQGLAEKSSYSTVERIETP